MGKIIRDEEGFGMFMLPLFVDWQIRRCNIKECKNKPSTILTQVHPEVPHAGICEAHYKEFLNLDGTLTFQATMEFDNFDAFADCPLEEGE